jgi:uncharacterized membrane protein YgdD (TMEM256/DUF423 family)
MMSSKQILLTGSVAGALAVALGAFGAHAFKPLLLENNAVETYKLAVDYHFFHALALLLIGALTERSSQPAAFGRAAVCMLGGVVLFSGSLYALALTGTRTVVLVTPLGGVFFLVGWGLLAVAVVQKK